MITGIGNPETLLRRLIAIIINDFYQKLGAKGKEAINNKLFYGSDAIAGKVGGQSIAQNEDEYPIVYIAVQREHLDMIYFSVEKEMKPYLMFIKGYPLTCKGIEDEELAFTISRTATYL